MGWMRSHFPAAHAGSSLLWGEIRSRWISFPCPVDDCTRMPGGKRERENRTGDTDETNGPIHGQDGSWSFLSSPTEARASPGPVHLNHSPRPQELVRGFLPSASLLWTSRPRHAWLPGIILHAQQQQQWPTSSAHSSEAAASLQLQSSQHCPPAAGRRPGGGGEREWKPAVRFEAERRRKAGDPASRGWPWTPGGGGGGSQVS